MTNEEAKRTLTGLIGYLQIKESLDEPTYKALNMAIEALKKAEKYKWHDLRKNPEDLPGFESVLICVKGFEGRTIGIDIAMHSKVAKCWGTVSCIYKDDEVIAWREIEPFEEE